MTCADRTFRRVTACRHTTAQIIAGMSLAALLQNAVADTGVDDLSKSQAFTVNASIVKGCTLGSGATDVTSLGTLSFGNVSSLDAPVDVASTQNAGSVVIKCTPGVSVTLALGSGNNVTGSVSSGRKLLKASGTETLTYQLFQDAAHATVWGDGTNGGSSQVFSSTGAVQEYKVYARLLASSTLPSAGNYTDSVLLTVTY